jgi:hypothetical protein
MLEKLDGFNLADHGDRHERERWELMRDRFPKYEDFWRLYIVPLTNRTSVPQRGHSWIRMRPDVPAQWEKLGVCHYSVFYYLSRAAQRRIECFGGNADRPTHPEDVIYLLQTCCENVGYFYNALRAVAKDAVSYLPRGIPKDFPFGEINAYRNLLLHNPVLGRVESDGETFLPKLPQDHVEAWISRFKFSWMVVGSLERKDLVSARVLLQSFEDGLAKYLNGTWSKLIRDLEGRKLHDQFRQVLRLPDSPVQLHSSNLIPYDSGCITVGQPVAASGTYNNFWASRPGTGKVTR